MPEEIAYRHLYKGEIPTTETISHIQNPVERDKCGLFAAEILAKDKGLEARKTLLKINRKHLPCWLWPRYLEALARMDLVQNVLPQSWNSENRTLWGWQCYRFKYPEKAMLKGGLIPRGVLRFKHVSLSPDSHPDQLLIWDAEQAKAFGRALQPYEQNDRTSTLEMPFLFNHVRFKTISIGEKAFGIPVHLSCWKKPRPRKRF